MIFEYGNFGPKRWIRNSFEENIGCNILSDTYWYRSKKRGELARPKQKYKDSKYHNKPNVMWVGIECMVLMSKNGKKIINYVLQIDHQF